MANPKLPGISESEQALLYAKLNEYNRGRASFKEAGVYLVVLPRPGKPNYSLWLNSHLPEKQSILYPFKNALWALRPAKPLGVLSRHPCRNPKPLSPGKGLYYWGYRP